MDDFTTKANEIIEAGKTLYQLGMVPATSGNFSARLGDGNIAITVSGTHKGKLQQSDIMVIDSEGTPTDGRRPSAETGLHVQIYKRFPSACAILHPHAMSAVLLSRNNTSYNNNNVIRLENYELLKAFPGIDTHDTFMDIPVFSNDQDIPRLVDTIDSYVSQNSDTPAYIIAGHGFYTWGESMIDALRHVEALDYLFACELKITNLNS